MIREFNFINIKGEEVTMVEISDENGNATQMTKALYDEQQANADKGTISQEYELPLEAVMKAARDEIGYQEGANNDNKFAKIAGHANNQPWCATFIRACFIKGKEEKAIPDTAYCPYIDTTELNSALTNYKQEINLTVNSNITLQSGYRYFVDTSAARTLTLPASPAVGNEILVFDASGTAATNNVTINSNSGKIS